MIIFIWLIYLLHLSNNTYFSPPIFLIIMIFLTKEKMISYSYSFCHIITFSLKYNPTLFNHLFHLLIHRSNVETDRGTGPRKFSRAHIPPLSSTSSGRTLARFGHESSTHSRSFLVSAPSFAFSHIRVKPEEYHRLFCRYVNVPQRSFVASNHQELDVFTRVLTRRRCQRNP